MSRRYEDPCGIARALNLVGERWGLLVVRELIHGPKRFRDLRVGLAGLSPNVLSQRLDELTARGLVRRRRAGPPIGADVYELTPLGAALEPVLLALATWGSRAAPPDPGSLSDDALILALRTTRRPDRTCPDGAYVLDLATDTFTVTVHGVELRSSRGAAAQPKATIRADNATLRAIAFGGRSAEQAMAAGDLSIDGNRTAAHRFLRLFERPALI